MLLRILPEHPGRHFGGVYVALRVGADAFHAVVVVLLRVGLHERNQRRDLAVARAAYADASREARVGPAVRLRIGDVNGVVPVDEHRSEEHTSELQSQSNLVCRLLLEKKKAMPSPTTSA